MTHGKTVGYSALYDDLDAALADLAALGALHDRDALGNYDAAVIGKDVGYPHVFRRAGRPAYRVVAGWLGGGTLRRRELHEAAKRLNDGEFGLIVVGEPALEQAVEQALTRAVGPASSSLDSPVDAPR